ncbi:MAG: aryl-sulfate sulfotransferase, partial [Chthoniobacterales bacterium]
MKRLISLLVLCGLLCSFDARADQAGDTTITLASQTAGPTPFIAKLTLQASDLNPLRSVRFSIAPKPGTFSRPLAATYTKEYLASRGYVQPVLKRVIVPVFGLYDGYSNKVNLTYRFADGSSTTAQVTVATEAFPSPPFNNPTVVKARTATPLSYDFILVASSNSTHVPTIIDTDGALRWVGTSGVQAHYVTLFQNGIYQTSGSKLLRMELDGTVTYLADYASRGVIGFHHNIDRGKYGIIVDVNTQSYIASVHLEVDATGRVLKEWNLADIISAAMRAGGDDPTGFVRQARGDYSFQAFEDWAHDNAVTYRRSDDSIIISSRENFVICLDYETGAIKWILGDQTKQWYQFPSLRRFALDVAPGGLAPVGQHAVSITHDDHLLLFDNGEPSAHHSPAGPRRSYSAGRKYQLDLEAKVATEVWNFDNNQTVRSPFRSSIYEDAPDNYLVDYAVARNPGGGIRAELLGLAPSGEKVFDYIYPTQAGYVA